MKRGLFFAIVSAWSCSSLASDIYLNSTFETKSFNYNLIKKKDSYHFLYRSTQKAYSIGMDYGFGNMPIISKYGIKPILGFHYYANGKLTNLKNESFIIPLGVSVDHSSKKIIYGKKIGFRAYYKMMPTLLALGEINSYTEYATMLTLKPNRGVFYEMGLKYHKFEGENVLDEDKKYFSVSIGVTY